MGSHNAALRCDPMERGAPHVAAVRVGGLKSGQLQTPAGKRGVPLGTPRGAREEALQSLPWGGAAVLEAVGMGLPWVGVCAAGALRGPSCGAGGVPRGCRCCGAVGTNGAVGAMGTFVRWGHSHSGAVRAVGLLVQWKH